MEFGDWPGWIALIVAIISPLITTVLTNTHQLKTARLQYDVDNQNKCGILIAELIHASTIPAHTFDGFSKNALEAAQYLDEDHLKLLINLSKQISAYKNDPENMHHTINELRFDLYLHHEYFSSYRATITEIITSLKNASQLR